jgi:transcriptional regulator GlxA family with amidase domain
VDRVVLIAFDGAQTLDLAGPAEVFATASRQANAPLYEVVLASESGGRIRTTCGFELRTRRLDRLRLRARDTVIVSGGEETGVRGATQSTRLIAWVRRAAKSARRIGSVCSGAFVLAAAGLLDGRRAATHWSACDILARWRPAVSVDPEAIFVRDGEVWTSAGVTTGIDMALAMVEADHGRALADRVAARLVLYARRPGFQSQFSEALLAQAEAGDPLAAIVARARAQLGDLDVTRLAALAGLSGRTLHRRCQEHLGITPAKLVQRLRVEHARTLLATTARPLKSIAYESGFSTSERMRRAFERELGVGPREVRLLFGARDGSNTAPRGSSLGRGVAKTAP